MPQVIELPPEGRLGPAMLELNERQRKFVVAMLETGGLNHTRAYMLAGYQGTENGLRVHAHRLAHDERVLAAIHEEASRRLKSGQILAVKELMEIVAAPTTSDNRKDKLKAIEMLMNRTGLHATSEHTVTVTHKDLTSDEMVKRIAQLAKDQGMDPKKLLGSVGVVLEGEFEEIVESKEGLEDVL